MVSKEEIEKCREILYDLIVDENVYGSIKKAVEGTFMYLGQLEQQNKALGKGQHSLMQSRRKWKRRYYKTKEELKEANKSIEQIYDDYQDIGKIAFEYSEKIEQLEEEIKNKDIENLCNECSTIAKECGFIEEDLDKIVAETKEMQTKADKYDLLVEKLEEILNKKYILLYVDDIADILAEVEEE